MDARGDRQLWAERTAQAEGWAARVIEKVLAAVRERSRLDPGQRRDFVGVEVDRCMADAVVCYDKDGNVEAVSLGVFMCRYFFHRHRDGWSWGTGPNPAIPGVLEHARRLFAAVVPGQVAHSYRDEEQCQYLLRKGPPADIIMDRGLGAIAGAVIGDAAGAPLEFTKPSREDVDDALTFPGGGPFCVGPGQGTDDTELTMACVTALLRDPTESSLAGAYRDWFATCPFDSGLTCRRAFGIGPLGPEAVASLNGGSKANGALMRATPLAARFFDCPDALDDIAAADAKLSHPNQVCVDANRVYCAAIAELIRSGDPARAVAVVQYQRMWVCPEVAGFIEESRAGPPDNATFQAGYLKWGFVAALAHLRMNSSYDSAIRQTLSAGGDTDTNAAIVGGMMGARWGLSGIPAAWRDAVLSPRDTDQHRRPAWLSPRGRLGDMERLVARP